MAWNKDVHRKISSAMETGDATEIERLLNENPDNLRDEAGSEIWLHRAASLGHSEVAEVLVRKGLGVNDPYDDHNPMTAIALAASRGHLNVVKWLVDHGAQINFDCTGLPLDIRPLTYAAISGRLDVVKFLVEHGADVDTPAGGMNALMHAEMYGNHEVVEYLKSLGSRDVREWMPKDFPASRRAMREAMTQIYGELIDFHLPMEGTGAPGVEILATVPHSTSGERAVFTLGLSEHELEDSDGQKFWTEIKLFLPSDWPLNAAALADPRWNWPVLWLQRITREAIASGRWPGLRSAVFMNGEPPQPLAPDTQQCGWLCLLRQGASYQMPDARWIEDRTLFAIYREEQQLIESSGYETLVKRFHEQEIPKHIAPARSNVG